MSLTIGIDYGGVCSIHDSKHEDESFKGEVGINMDGCLESLQRLSKKHKLVLISFCGLSRARETKKYLSTLSVNPFSEVYFVKKRPNKQKICEFVGADIMIDDRLDILEVIKNTKTLHFKSHPSDTYSKFVSNYMADSWLEIEKIIDTLKPVGLVPQKNMSIQSLIYN